MIVMNAKVSISVLLDNDKRKTFTGEIIGNQLVVLGLKKSDAAIVMPYFQNFETALRSVNPGYRLTSISDEVPFGGH